MNQHTNAIRFLTTLPCFRGLDADTIRRLGSRCRELSLRSGQQIFAEGEPCRRLYILVAGRVKCYRASPEGREQILKLFERPGDIFCTTSAFSTGSHIVTAETMSAVTLYAIDVETMKRVALEQPAVALALVTVAGEQMRSLVGLADDLALKTATARVAKLLCERARAGRGRTGEEIRLGRDGLREEQIAAMVGTVRVHVSRSLKILVGLGAITLDRTTIRISDLQVLEALVDAAESATRGPRDAPASTRPRR